MKRIVLQEEPYIVSMEDDNESRILKAIPKYPTAYLLSKHLKIPQSTLFFVLRNMHEKQLVTKTLKSIRYSNQPKAHLTSYYTIVGKRKQ